MADYFLSMVIFSGFIIGMIFGILIQKYQICGANAVAKLIYFRNTEYFKIMYVAISIEIIFFTMFSIAGCASCLSSELSFILTPFGGLMFGFGMIISSGCASGICYKSAEGNNQTLFSLAFFFFSGYLMTRMSIITDMLDMVRSKTTLVPQSEITLPMLTGIPDVLFALIVLVAIFMIFEIVVWKNREKLRDRSIKETVLDLKGSWIIAALVLGVIGVSAPVLSSLTGNASGMNISKGLIDELGSIIDAFLGLELGYSIDWAGMFVIGTVLGAFFSAKKWGQFKITKPKLRSSLRASMGGMMMGSGAVLTGSCNVGHLLSGLPILSVSSIISLLFIFAGGVLAVKMLDI
ncbi:MAG: YeeE/YedE family protein [Candidatus Hodarchaeales archaeon]